MKHPQKMMVAQPHFLGEQDGPPERQLKAALMQFFCRDRSVHTAYLARVFYGKQTAINVTLCLRTEFGLDPGLAEKIGRIFASIFGSHEHLDLLFLNDEQEGELRKVALAFYNKDAPPT